MKIGIVLLLLIALNGCSQRSNVVFRLVLEPLSIDELVGIQAFAYGKHDGKWLIVGGRLDGLHRRQPWATFDEEGQNKQLIVIDPVAGKKWSATTENLPAALREQLCSTNMESYQEGETLYILGGYGYSQLAGDHITYPNLTAIDVPEAIAAIVNGAPIDSCFRQLVDERFAVTGGYLNKIYNTFYLTGGQRFEGRYNPMGHPSYIQTYTNSIRKFRIADDGKNLAITHLATLTDTTNLHRRDFNVVPQIMPDGQEGLTAFSGVFQPHADLPYLNCVNIDSAGYVVNNEFKQYYNQYHCAHVPLFSNRTKEMHTFFFGGISQFYDSAGVLMQHDDVPFVRTIARVTRDQAGKMTEYKLEEEMPGLLGASSEFIPADHLPEFPNGVLKSDELKGDSTLIGYIFGGINSTNPNIFWRNNGTQSSASHVIYKVFLLKSRRQMP